MATASVRVLLVEDDHDDARLVNDLLADAKRARFIVDTVGTAEDAKAKVKKNRYNVILLDYRLPDSTGLLFTQWLNDNHFRVPVVLVTSFGDTRLQAEALDAGVCEYLEKGSFNADVLERTLMYAIGLHDRQMQDSGSGVGILIQELVGLTRESVTAQTRTANQMAELRQDIDEKIESVLKEVKKGQWEKVKAVLDWGVAHPWAAVIIILMLALLVTLTVLLINVLDAEKIKQLKGAVGFLLPVIGRLGDESYV